MVSFVDQHVEQSSYISILWCIENEWETWSMDSYTVKLTNQECFRNDRWTIEYSAANYSAWFLSFCGTLDTNGVRGVSDLYRSADFSPHRSWVAVRVYSRGSSKNLIWDALWWGLWRTVEHGEKHERGRKCQASWGGVLLWPVNKAEDIKKQWYPPSQHQHLHYMSLCDDTRMWVMYGGRSKCWIDEILSFVSYLLYGSTACVGHFGSPRAVKLLHF